MGVKAKFLSEAKPKKLCNSAPKFYSYRYWWSDASTDLLSFSVTVYYLSKLFVVSCNFGNLFGLNSRNSCLIFMMLDLMIYSPRCVTWFIGIILVFELIIQFEESY